MKKSITLPGFCTLLFALLVFSQASGQNDKNKGKKEHQSQSHSKDKPGKGNSGSTDIEKEHDAHPQGNDHKSNKANGKDKKDKKDISESNDGGEAKGKDGYHWNHETFKERSKIKEEKKVTVCHKFKGDEKPGVTLKVSSHALQAHLNHGDVTGECPANTKTNYSNNFLGKRTDYYNDVQHTQEQVAYSQSVLAYARERLSNSRKQLAVMQSNNTPVQAIEQKKTTVVELEQNVSLLETLIGVTANVLANKLQ